jgi:hypothetical protein
MKISERTLQILKNFSTINPSIALKEGNAIATVAHNRNIIVDAKIEETIPKDFCIYDLNNFLSLLSLFKDGAELEFDDDHVLIVGMDGRSKVKYRTASPNTIVAAPDKRPTLPFVDVTFNLTAKDFTWLIRTASVLGSPNFAIESDGSKVTLKTFDLLDDSAHTNTLTLDTIDPEGLSYTLIFKTENLKIIPSEYVVEICSKGLAKFTDNNNELIYYVSIETASVYN